MADNCLLTHCIFYGKINKYLSAVAKNSREKHEL